MFDIVTFGSAARDIFLKSKTFQVSAGRRFSTGEGICLASGSKIDIDNIYFASGGGGTNTAATFALQGFEVAFCGMVGDDSVGKNIIEELNDFGVDTNNVFKTKLKSTNHSIILDPRNDERTILVYRGASGELPKEDIPLEKLQSKWFYLAPLSAKLSGSFEYLVNYAHDNNIKIAVNPGSRQLSLSVNKLKKILKNVDLFFLNKEEASKLTKIPYEKEREIFKKLDKIVSPGIVIMTKGPDGAVVSDGEFMYSAVAPRTKVIDTTGAGDAFASGFLSGLIQSNNNIEYAIQLGMANSVSCIQKIGAKTGLLKKGQIFKKVKVRKELCSKNGLCLPKKGK